MTEMPPVPSSTFCAGCTSQLTWLWSASKQAWVAFVPCGCGERWSVSPHRCRELQDPATWREIPHGDPPSDEYRRVRQELATKETT